MTRIPAFHVAVFLGAFLLFLVQPLVAKQILPWFGGAPAVWTTCLLFFQTALVGGYAYAHLTRRLGLTRQVWLHLTLLGLALLTLPIVPSAAWKPVDAAVPVWRVLGVLVMTVGIPYTLLSATAPMLQDWFARARTGKSPYPLYALSNAGSLLALMAFPAAFERWLPSPVQAVWWSVAFAIFVVVCAWCAREALAAAGRDPVRLATVSREQLGGAPPTALDRMLWVALAACGSALLMAVTNQLCQDVAVVPLLWIVPLALYLVTFIVSFAGYYRRPVWVALYTVSAGAAALALATAADTAIGLQATALLATLFTGCLVCHGELVKLRPRVEDLTSFYLAMSAGGSLGGIFVALVAPLLFTSYAELPLLVLLVFVLLFGAVLRDRASVSNTPLPAPVLAVPIIAFLVAGVVTLQAGSQSPSTLATSRNFYGVLRAAVVAGPPARRELYHGRVLHGAQLVEPGDPRRPTTYFAAGSGIDVAMNRHPKRATGGSLSIGVIGLGAGTIAAWGAPDDQMRFYELNPDVVDFAERYFDFLGESAADVDVVVGDARLALEREVAAGNRQPLDILVVDAFSGDSIPVHLLTREAFALYGRAIRDDGILALHVSNRHLDLRPVVRGLAAEASLDVLEITTEAEPSVAKFTSEWMLVTSNRAFAEAARDSGATNSIGPTLIWTDAYSSLISVLR